MAKKRLFCCAGTVSPTTTEGPVWCTYWIWDSFEVLTLVVCAMGPMYKKSVDTLLHPSTSWPDLDLILLAHTAPYLDCTHPSTHPLQIISYLSVWQFYVLMLPACMHKDCLHRGLCTLVLSFMQVFLTTVLTTWSPSWESLACPLFLRKVHWCCTLFVAIYLCRLTSCSCHTGNVGMGVS